MEGEYRPKTEDIDFSTKQDDKRKDKEIEKKENSGFIGKVGKKARKAIVPLVAAVGFSSIPGTVGAAEKLLKPSADQEKHGAIDKKTAAEKEKGSQYRESTTVIEKEIKMETELPVFEGEITDEWLWNKNNIGKVFINGKGDSIIALAEGSSLQEQLALNKARFEANRLLAEYIKKQKNLSPDASADLELMTIPAQDVKQTENNIYKAVVLITMPWSGNSENRAQQSMEKVSIKQERRNILNDDEIVIPDKVMEAFYQTLDKDSFTQGGSAFGGYLDKNYLSDKDRQNEFMERLSKIGYSKKEAQDFLAKLQKPGQIIFSEGSLEDSSFENYLTHERFHREMKGLSQEKINKLQEAAQEIMSRRRQLKQEEKAIAEKTGSTDMPFLEVQNRDPHAQVDPAFLAQLRWDEFYAYLSVGTYVPDVEKALEKDHPEAYQIYSEIKNKCQVKTEQQ